MQTSEQLNELATALSKLQGEIKDAEKDTSGYGYKYADLPQVLSIIRPLACKYGLSFTQHVESDGGDLTLTTFLLHQSGQWIKSFLTLPKTQFKSMNEAQAVGALITYMRRYALTSIFGFSQAAEDNDAKEYVAPKQQVQQYKKADYAPAPIDNQKASQVIASDVIKGHIKTIEMYFGEGDKLGVCDYWAQIDSKTKENIKSFMAPNVKEWLRSTVTKGPKPAPVDYMGV